MSGRNLSGSTVTGRLEEGRRMDEGGGVGGRRIGSLDSELKPKIIGIKQANSKKLISDKGTSTGKVRKLILGYETLVVKDADLKLRNHETNFKISIENSYQSPEKRREKLTREASPVQGTRVAWAGSLPHHLCHALHPVGVDGVC